MTQLAIFSLLTLSLMKKYATEREYMYNEILPPIIEKQKIIGTLVMGVEIMLTMLNLNRLLTR